MNEIPAWAARLRAERLRPDRMWSRARMARELRAAAAGRVAVAHPASLRDQIRGWEKGKHQPSEVYRTLYAVVFEVDEAELFAADQPRASLEDLAGLAELPPVEEVLARVVAATGRRVGTETVTALAERVHALRLADDVLPGGDLVEPAFRQLANAVRLYRDGGHREEVGRALLGLVAEFAQLAGWVAADAGQPGRAASTYQLGIEAAREAGDSALESNLLGALAYLTSNGQKPRGGVELAEAAVAAAGKAAVPLARALAWDRLAWAEAKTGSVASTSRALGNAAAALSEAGPETERSWLYWVSADELQVMEARAYTELHRPLRAIPILAKVLERYDPSHARELALYLSWLAVGLADAHEPEAAATAAHRMLDLSAGLASSRTAERARTVLARLAPYRSTVPEVAELWDQYRVSIADPARTLPPA